MKSRLKIKFFTLPVSLLVPVLVLSSFIFSSQTVWGGEHSLITLSDEEPKKYKPAKSQAKRFLAPSTSSDTDEIESDDPSEEQLLFWSVANSADEEEIKQ